ncbi:Ribosomal large subunit pseudouridine synthase A [Corynebacterium occultum]|uniref:RNA pseudouridylate synthase n=2 Tax=Corynebacterium occultum TaxID=2675219 RepID=A0A6B8W022_9CORY|nr:Ribosomal large subunit pseudouridine synthase A [Corynebacterium occultum]
MSRRLVQRLGKVPPLPIKDGLNASRVRVPEEAAGISARDFVEHLINSQRHRSPQDDAAALDRRFVEELVVDNRSQPYTPDEPLPAGADVWFYRVPAEEPHVPFECEIIHQDENILVVDKPSYLATMPRGRHITETALVRMRRSTGIQELSPAHRLDRLTSGVLVFTAKPEVRGAYQTLFARREAMKTYLAVADHDSSLDPTQGPILWESRMEKTPGHIKGEIVEGEPNALTWLTKVTPVSDEEQAALEAVHGPLARQAHYELKPETGKTHQLRLHMWAAGIPILGDPVYPRVYTEEEEDMSIPMHLNARELTFTDPFSGELRIFRSTRI